MRRLAELKFDVRHVVYREGSFERGKDMKLPLSDIKKYIADNFNKEDSVVSIDIDKIYSKNVTIDNELSRGGGEQLFISPPKGMKWDLFLTLLERRGLLDEDKVRGLFRRGVQKRAELHFDVEITRYYIRNLHRANERFSKLASTKQRFTLNEIKDSLFSTSEDYVRNQKSNDSYFFGRYDLFQRDGVITARYMFREEIEEYDQGYVTYITVTKPDHLPKKLFESMIKGAANVIR